jgi:hypothetical protein
MPAEPHRYAPAHRLSRQGDGQSGRSAGDRHHGKDATSVGLLGNAAELLPLLYERGVRPTC